MDLLTDLNQIEKQASLQWQKNRLFRDWLNKLKPAEVEQAFDDFSKKISAQIDCQKCANCCKAHTITPTNSDIRRLSQHLNLEPWSFRDKFLKKDFEGDLVFKQKPCPFLKNNSCSVYEARPTTCRSYPHLQIDHMLGRGWKVIENTFICPIVFNVYAQLRVYFAFDKLEANLE